MYSAFEAAGIHTKLVGVMPTPAVAIGVSEFKCDMGVVLTASHNPASDNGIKLFNKEGFKLSLDAELEIESLIHQILEGNTNSMELIDRRFMIYEKNNYYVNRLKSIVKKNEFEGYKIVLDCANGAASKFSPEILRYSGVELFLIGNNPDGNNINEKVGSEYPEGLKDSVICNNADLGLAHDGDSDRLVVCDEKGKILEGDILLGLYAQYLYKKNLLANNRLVVTIQSNIGLDNAMKKIGCLVERVQIGDRNVAEKIRSSGANFGGESSGHIIFNDYSSTGDGILAAIQLLKLLKHSESTMSELKSEITLYPQKTKNLNVKEKIPFEELNSFKNALLEADNILMNKGRLLVRYSGTQDVLRILVEAKTEYLVEKVMQIIVTEACNSLDIL